LGVADRLPCARNPHESARSQLCRRRSIPMKATILIFGASALALSPSFASAQTAPGNGQYNGNGYWHQNSGNANGQPGASCEDVVAAGGSTPGNSATAPGGGSPFS